MCSSRVRRSSFVGQVQVRRVMGDVRYHSRMKEIFGHGGDGNIVVVHAVTISTTVFNFIDASLSTRLLSIHNSLNSRLRQKERIKESLSCSVNMAGSQN